MELNKIVNILLLLLIVHILLKTSNINFSFGNEHFGNNSPINKFDLAFTGSSIETDGSQFNVNLNGNLVPNEADNISDELDIEQELYDYAVRDENDIEGFTSGNSSVQSNTYLPNGLPNGNKISGCNDIKSGNHFASNYNIPNFSSECANTQKYYSLKNDNHAYYYDDKGNKHNITERNVSNSISNSWKYKNEIPMNGGAIFDNVSGVDDFDDQFATFNSQNNNIDSKFFQQEQKHIIAGTANKTIWN
jgi:hypothetical protein